MITETQQRSIVDECHQWHDELVAYREKINKLKEKTSVNFKEIHFLKTSFSMIGCVEGIKICEKLIQKQDTMDIQSLCHIFELSKEVLSQKN